MINFFAQANAFLEEKRKKLAFHVPYLPHFLVSQRFPRVFSCLFACLSTCYPPRPSVPIFQHQKPRRAGAVTINLETRKFVGLRDAQIFDSYPLDCHGDHHCALEHQPEHLGERGRVFSGEVEQ